MVTGDNAQTAIAVARQCGPGIFTREGTKGMRVLDCVKEEESGLEKLVIRSVETGEAVELKGRVVWKDFDWAMTGAAFHSLRSHEEDWSLKLREVMKHVSVFARCNPKDKQEVIRSLQSFHRSVSMIGDGSNDAYALKQADVGISISSTPEQEPEDPESALPSIAAHFSSPNDSISTVAVLLAEGRGALATSMVAFRYMWDYAFIQFIAVLLLYTLGTNLSDDQFLMGDMISVLPLIILLDLTPSSTTLVPGVPQADLTDIHGFLGGNLLHLSLLAIGDILLLWSVRSGPFALSSTNAARTILFFATAIHYSACALSLTHTYGGFRKNPIYANKTLIIVAVGLLTFSCLLIGFDSSGITDPVVSFLEGWFNNDPLPLANRLLILCYTFVFTTVLVVAEFFVLRHVVPIHKLK